MKKKRLDEIDFLRGICIIYMILGHIIPDAPFWHYIHAFHMPVFYVVSGMFLVREKNTPILELCKKLCKRLLIPYFVFGVIFAVIYRLHIFPIIGEPKRFLLCIKELFTYNDNLVIGGALWFLTSFFFSSLILNLLNRIKNDYLFIILCLLTMLFGIYFQKLLSIKLILSIQSSLVGVGLMGIGYLLNKHKVLEKLSTNNIFIIIVMTIIHYCLIMKTGYVNLRSNEYPNIILFIINIISSMCLYISLGKVVKKYCHNLYLKITDLGENSIFSLCLNQFIILCITLVFSKLHMLELFNTYLFYFIEGYLTMFIIEITTHIVLKGKLKILFGK